MGKNDLLNLESSFLALGFKVVVISFYLMVWSNNLLFGQTSNIIELEKIETAKDIKKLFYFTPDQDISDADIVSGKYDQSFKPADVIMLNLGRQKSSWVKINLHSPYKKQMKLLEKMK